MKAHPNHDPTFDPVYVWIQYWLDHFFEVFGEPDCGSHRACFRSGDYVYKVPLSMKGIDDNMVEAELGGGEYYASCWILREEEDGVPILVMERVIHTGGTKEPSWTWSIDCGQVGYSVVTGKLVAYDYAR